MKTTNNLTVGYLSKKTLFVIYKGAVVVWEAIKSCFGRGFWTNIQPWSNKDGWSNF